MIVIAGAGIGGLTLACALARGGRAVRVLEQAGALQPAGAGIALARNALRALAHIGLEALVREAGHPLLEAAICNHRGKTLLAAPVPDTMGVTLAFARSDLQRVLLDAFPGTVELGRRVVGYRQAVGAGAVEVLLETGETLEAELLVGADGLRSAVRRTMRGEEPVRYAGYTSWRALVDGWPAAVRFTESWGAGARFGIVPLRAGRVYWFAAADAPEGLRDPADAVGALRTRFARWHAPIDDLLAATPPERLLRTDIHDRRPVDSWVDGRVALLGDAAHPMTPNLGQGGCQAIEDAVVLADVLARHDDVSAALAGYERRRIGRANSFVARSYNFGRLAHLRAAPLRWLRDRALRAVPSRLTAKAAARDMDFAL
jgi:2-polyprenyl-6-methoxyphenol hydroxylase-like FAD-dependent oxidoreductase